MLNQQDIEMMTHNIAGQLEIQLQPIVERLGGLEKRLDGLHLDYEVLIGRFDKMELQVATLEGKVDRILAHFVT